jgi:hypothetical protein
MPNLRHLAFDGRIFLIAPQMPTYAELLGDLLPQLDSLALIHPAVFDLDDLGLSEQILSLKQLSIRIWGKFSDQYLFKNNPRGVRLDLEALHVDAQALILGSDETTVEIGRRLVAIAKGEVPSFRAKKVILYGKDRAEGWSKSAALSDIDTGAIIWRNYPHSPPFQEIGRGE